MVMPSFTKKYYHAPYPAIDPNRPELSADGKVVVITGGGSGIGQASALAFAKAHAKVVVILGRRINALQETKHLVQRLDGGTTIATYSVDITDEQAVADCFRDITFRYGRIDVCIHAAAYLANKGTIKDTKLSEFWASFDIGVKGTFIVTQQFLHYCSEHSPLLVAVNSLISHLAAVHVDSAPASYAASKIAVAKMVEYTAAENPHVRCYSLHPGVIDTDMSRKSIAMMPEDKRESQPFLPFDDGEISISLFHPVNPQTGSIPMLIQRSVLTGVFRRMACFRRRGCHPIGEISMVQLGC